MRDCDIIPTMNHSPNIPKNVPGSKRPCLNPEDRTDRGIGALVCPAKATATKDDKEGCLHSHIDEPACIRSEKRSSGSVFRLGNRLEHWKFESGKSLTGQTGCFDRFRIAIGRRRRVSAPRELKRPSSSAQGRTHERGTAFTSCKTRTRRFPSFEIKHKKAGII